LSISLLLSTFREENKVEISEEDVEAELNVQAAQYPADQLDAFKNWMKGQQEQMAQLRDRLLEKKCVACIMEQVKVKPVSLELDEWQAMQDAAAAQDD